MRHILLVLQAVVDGAGQCWQQIEAAGRLLLNSVPGHMAGQLQGCVYNINV